MATRQLNFLVDLAQLERFLLRLALLGFGVALLGLVGELLGW